MRPSRAETSLTRLRKAENVVNEQQRVGSGRVAEEFGHGQGGQSDAKSRTWRLVHLTEDHARLFDDHASGLTDLGLLHFQPQVGAFASSLAHAGKHRVTTVGAGDSGDQLGQNDRLAQTGTTEQPSFTTANERCQQVDHLDPRFEQLGVGRQLVEGGCMAVNRPIVVGLDLAAFDRRASPSTLKTRPSVALPTGTVIGLPVSTQSSPRISLRCYPGPRNERVRRPGAAGSHRSD